jgi:hypothetical protein
MTDLDAQRIRDAFDQDLAGYRAPSDFLERVHAGGLQRARRRRVRRAACAAVVACIAAGAVALIAPLAGTGRTGASHPGTGRARPGAASRARLPSSASVAKAMLATFAADADDILYSTEVDTNKGPVVDTYRDWIWPAQPQPGQLTSWRNVYTGRTPLLSSPLRLVEDDGLVYQTPANPNAPVRGGVLTQVCFFSPGGCGFGGDADTPAGTWSHVTLRNQSLAVSSNVGEGSPFYPPALAQAIVDGQWQIVRRTQIDGQPTLVLSETRAGHIYPRPFLLWVSARTYLPLKFAASGGGVTSSGIFAYLPPTRANRKLLQVPIPRGYPRSNPLKS